jgi:hypothetical protein
METQQTETKAQYQYNGPTIADALRGWDGIPELARELRVRVTAHERHRARLLGTIRAAAEYIWGDNGGPAGDIPLDLATLACRSSDDRDTSTEWTALLRERRIVAALIMLDLHGIGGHGGYSGGASSRMTWARRAGLGKARWQASDGGAWRGAAEAAVYVLGFDPERGLDPSTFAGLLDYLAPEDDVWVVAYATHQIAQLVDRGGTADESAYGPVRDSRGIETAVRDELWLWDALRVAAVTDSPKTEEQLARARQVSTARDQMARLHLQAPACVVVDEHGEKLQVGEVVAEHVASDQHTRAVALHIGEAAPVVVDRWEAAERLTAVAMVAAAMAAAVAEEAIRATRARDLNQ